MNFTRARDSNPRGPYAWHTVWAPLLQALGKMGSAIAGVLAVLQYTIITAIFVRVLGSGADAYSIIGLLVVCVIAVIVALWAP